MNILKSYLFLLDHPSIVSKWHDQIDQRDLQINNSHPQTTEKTETQKANWPTIITNLECYSNTDGLNYISASSVRSIDFVYKRGYFSFKCGNVQDIIKAGIKIYVYGALSCTSGPFFCSLYQIENLLIQFSNSIYDIELKEYRFPASLIPFYLKTIENEQDPAHRYTSYHSYCYYDKRYRDLFSNQYLYKQVEWTREAIDKYHDSLNWKGLIQDSNFTITEDLLEKFCDLIPLESINYRSINVSFSFIKKHIDQINLEKWLRSTSIAFSPNELFYLLSWWNENWHNKPNRGFSGEDNCVKALIDNSDFCWSEDLLKVLSMTNPSSGWLYFPTITDDRRRLQIYDMIIKIPGHEEAIKKLSKPDYYLERLKDGEFYGIYSDSYNGSYMYGGPFPELIPYEGEIDPTKCYTHKFEGLSKLINKNKTYSTFFTLDNIKANLSSWNTVIADTYQYHHRECTDHSYDFYQVFTIWNLYKYNRQVRINYEIVDYFRDKEIVVGGEYRKEHYDIDKGFVTKPTNALDFFIQTPIENRSEIEKICDDDELCERFYKGLNPCVLDYICDKVFSVISYDDYLEQLNKRK